MKRQEQSIKHWGWKRLLPAAACILASAAMKDTVGEYVAAFEVGSDLYFIDGEEMRVDTCRHGLNRADPVTGGRRDDALLAGDERDSLISRAQPRPIVNLAREQAER